MDIWSKISIRLYGYVYMSIWTYGYLYGCIDIWIKKACLDGDSVGTGMYTHFKSGCPAGTGGGELNHLKWTILDHSETTLENLTKVVHQGGPQCRCSDCQRLKTVEDKWICRMGSFYGDSGLNTRDEVKSRSRVNFVGQK